MANAGSYTVTARNSVGTVASSSAVVGMFSMVMSNGTPHLAVAAPVGNRFRLDYSGALEAGMNWQTLTNFTMISTMVQMNATAPQGSQARFYRVVMIP
jgi:hypothetical protein